MARYIDADALIAEYDRVHVGPAGGARKLMVDAPTADVAPKSEVERLTVELDAMRGAANTYKMHYENARKEIERLKDNNTGVAFKHYFDGRKETAREIFAEIEDDYADYLFDGRHNILVLTEKDFAELKKKYTEEKE